MRKSHLLLLIPLAYAGGCDSPAEPPADEIALAGSVADAVPFKDRATFHMAPGSPLVLCAPLYSFGPPRDYIGTGNTSHMGATTTTITFDACTLDLTGASLFTATGHVVHTAANGDELWSSWTLTQYPDGSFGMGSTTVNGGTGRFANATGTASGQGWIDGATYAGYWTVSGTLSYPGH